MAKGKRKKMEDKRPSLIRILSDGTIDGNTQTKALDRKVQKLNWMKNNEKRCSNTSNNESESEPEVAWANTNGKDACTSSDAKRNLQQTHTCPFVKADVIHCIESWKCQTHFESWQILFKCNTWDQLWIRKDGQLRNVWDKRFGCQVTRGEKLEPFKCPLMNLEEKGTTWTKKSCTNKEGWMTFDWTNCVCVCFRFQNSDSQGGGCTPALHLTENVEKRKV